MDGKKTRQQKVKLFSSVYDPPKHLFVMHYRVGNVYASKYYHTNVDTSVNTRATRLLTAYRTAFGDFLGEGSSFLTQTYATTQ